MCVPQTAVVSNTPWLFETVTDETTKVGQKWKSFPNKNTSLDCLISRLSFLSVSQTLTEIRYISDKKYKTMVIITHLRELKIMLRYLPKCSFKPENPKSFKDSLPHLASPPRFFFSSWIIFYRSSFSGLTSGRFSFHSTSGDHSSFQMSKLHHSKEKCFHHIQRKWDRD